jgi:CheY-like chemotaxis protein
VIFKEFLRLEETASLVRGLGLGLSIVERIGKVLDHRIGLRSVSGRGSIFSVELPAAEPRLGAVAETVPSAGRIAGLTVLCIDNEPAFVRGLQSLLVGWGCRVITAASGAEAIERLAGSSATPDIMLVDYHLDHGTGLQAAAALRAAASASAPVQAPIVVITADGSAEVQREARLAGCTLLRKPLKPAALRALIYQLARRRAVAAE